MSTAPPGTALTGAFRFVVVAALALGWASAGLAAGATPATAASCDSPEPSPDAFRGVVLETAAHGRIATVRTDDKRIVTVHGGAMGTTVWSSADRTYTVGAHYEFHPRDDAPPYRDDICTATHPINESDSDSAWSHTGWLVAVVVAAAVAGWCHRQ